MQGIEPFGKNLIEGQECFRIISCEECVCQREGIFIVEHIQILQHILVLDFCAAEGDCLVEYCQRVPHCPVRLVGYDMQGFVIDVDSFLFSDSPELFYYIVDCYPVEVVCLASRQDGRQYLVLFCGGEDEDCMCRRLFESLQESVERSLRQHVDLVDDIDTVFPDLRRNPHLVHEGLDIVDTVVGCGIKLVYAV